MLYLFIFSILSTKIIEQYLIGFTLIFFVMRALSVVNVYLSSKSFDLKKAIGYMFFFPALLTGPHTPFQKWKKYSFDSSVFINKTLSILLMVILILISGIIIPYLIKVDDLGIKNLFFFDYLVFLFLYIQFYFASKIVVDISAIFSQPCTENFDRPLSSQSITEFWTRWHVSLGGFFRENFFNPLFFMIQKKKIFSQNTSYIILIILTFLMIGLWHSFNKNYLLFGLYFGLVQALERFLFKGVILNRSENGVFKFLKILYTQVFHLLGFSLVSEIIFNYVLVKT